MPDLFEGTNLVPVGVDHRVQTLAGAALTVDVGAGRAGGPWTVVGFGVAAHGTVGIVGPGVLRYRPQTGFVGIDYFWFEIENPEQSRALGWVEIRVFGVNRAPVAAGQLVLVAGDGPVTIDVLAAASDPDGDRLRITDLTLPAHGLLALNADQTLTYTPLASWTPRFTDFERVLGSSLIRLWCERPRRGRFLAGWSPRRLCFPVSGAMRAQLSCRARAFA